MVCDICGLEIADPAVGCVWCKSREGTPVSRPLPDPRIVSAKLAEANLARMRGHWEEAEALCVDVLRMDPSNLEAHSLLGDLYRDQERLDDAVQWYRLALDINSDSAIDQAKLRAVEKEIERRSKNAREPSTPGPITAPIGTRSLLGASPVTWVRVLTIVCVVFVVGVGVALIALRGRHRHAPTVPSTSPAPSAPAAIAGTRPPSQPSRRPLRIFDRPGGSFTPGPGMTPLEITLSQAVNEPGVLPSGTTLIDITVAESALRADVVLMRTDTPNATGDSVRTAVIAAATSAARTVLAAAPQLMRVHIGVRTRMADGTVQPTFDASTDRQSVTSLPQQASPAVEALAFQNPWWANNLTQQPPASSAHPDDNNM